MRESPSSFRNGCFAAWFQARWPLMSGGRKQAIAFLVGLLCCLWLSCSGGGGLVKGPATEDLAADVNATLLHESTEGWPEFRGPTGQGHSSSNHLPLTWSETENIVWKAPIPGRGWSSPVLLEREIWVTAAAEGGKSLRAVAIDSDDGSLLHDIEVFRIPEPPAIHEKNGYASPTPILEGDRIYVHFGAQGTAAVDRSGNVVWKTQQLQYKYGNGSGGSPALVGDLLIINCDGTDRQYVVALDKNTGQVRWKRERVDGDQAYSTPLAIRVGESEQVISTGGNRASAYDPRTGEELWWIHYQAFSLVPRPVLGEGLVYITTGPGSGSPTALIAVVLGGKGDVTDSHVAWKWTKGVSRIASPLLVGDELYFVRDNGILTCLDAKTGQPHYRQRLNGEFSASPIYAAGRIYWLSESGETVVIEPGANYKELARNQLDSATLASPAVVGDALFIRTESHLYRIEEQRVAHN